MSNDSSEITNSVSESDKPDGHSLTKAPWGPLAAIFYGFFGTAFGVQIVSGVVLIVFLALIGMQEADINSWSTTILGQFLFVLTAEVWMILAVILYVRLKKASLRTLGMDRPRFSHLGTVLLGTLAYFAMYICTVVAVSIFMPSIDLEQQQQLGFDNPANLLQYGMVFASLVILPPLAEEVLFRGFIFAGFRSKLRFLPSVLITSVLFAVGHLQFGSGAPLLWVAAIDTFVLSLVLCFVREKTGSLWPSIGIHALKNLIAFLFLFIFV